MSKANQWLREDLQRVEGKVDNLAEKVIPDLLVKITEITTEKVTEAKHSAKMQGWFYGGITLVISLTSLAVAYFKN